MPGSEVDRTPFGRRARRWLIIAHRWIGIVTCLFFTIWFVSGLVMIYVPFPNLRKSERLAGLAPIDWRLVRVDPARALAASEIDGVPRSIDLEMRDRVPVWRIEWWDGTQAGVSAASGRLIRATDRAGAWRVAGDFAHARVVAIEPIERDQWTVSGSFDRDRPLWKASLDGPAGQILYVSRRTGAVVLDTDARERFWNWVGSVPHWIYPTALRQDDAAWRQVVMWVSGPCILGAVTGMWIGISRLRVGRRRFRGGRITPYRSWMKWHHLSGLVGGLFLTTWIFSGWLSVDPFRLFFGGRPGVGQTARIAWADAGVPPPLPPGMAAIGQGAKRVGLRWFAGRPFLIVEHAGGRDRILDADSLRPTRIAPETLRCAAARLIPGARIVAIERLTAPDAYWYEAGGLPILPAVRVKYADPARTWVHLDPATGAILGEIDARGRVYRWAFSLLHTWDLNGLTRHRPAWDLWLWLLSSLGLMTSVTAIRVGWARLRRPAARGVQAGVQCDRSSTPSEASARQ